jgi:hypothetical protein
MRENANPTSHKKDSWQQAKEYFATGGFYLLQTNKDKKQWGGKWQNQLN